MRLRQGYDVAQHAEDVGGSVLQSAQYGLYVRAEIQAVHPAALGQRVHEGGVPGNGVAVALEPVLPSIRNIEEAAIEGVVADFQKPAGQECREALAVVEQVVGGAQCQHTVIVAGSPHLLYKGEHRVHQRPT